MGSRKRIPSALAMDLSLRHSLGYREHCFRQCLPVSTGLSGAANNLSHCSDRLSRKAGIDRCSARAFDFGGQVTKGVWGMSWRQEALKGVEDCDKHGVAVKQAMIP